MADGKSETAFRTISEVGASLDLKPHVLRFWEGKFTEIQPVKRGNGRRYYRPEDVALIAGIKHLLHGQGLTIKGVQKVLKDDGVAAVRALADAPVEKPAGDGPQLSAVQRDKLRAVRQDLAQLHALLRGEDA